MPPPREHRRSTFKRTEDFFPDFRKGDLFHFSKMLYVKRLKTVQKPSNEGGPPFPSQTPMKKHQMPYFTKDDFVSFEIN